MGMILSIDQGTSGTKALAVAGDGSIKAIAEVPIRPQYLSGGLVEQDPAELYESIEFAVSKVVAECSEPILGISLSNQGETVLAWNPDTGEPLTKMIVWQDGRSQSVCDQVAEHSDEIAEQTGLVLDPYFSAPKQAWIRQNLTREGVVTTSDSWIIYKLTGEFVTDTATAGRSLMVSLDTGHWDERLQTFFGLEGERMPRIASNDEIVGTTDLVGYEVPLGGLIVDQQAALLAQGCLAAGEAKCTFGTGAFFLANLGGEAIRSSSGLASCVAWRVEDELTYCLDGQVYTAASAVRWLQDVGVIAEPADLDRLVSDDSEGVICVPALAGLAAPWWRSDAKGSFQGLALGTSRAHLVTAVCQGLAAQVAKLGELVESDLGKPITSLRVDGGLTRSKRFMQTVANLCQVEVELYPSPHATPLGAAALMRKALEPSESLASCVPDWQPLEAFSPVWSSDRADEFKSKWNEAVETSFGRS